jgi:signal peptidase
VNVTLVLIGVLVLAGGLAMRLNDVHLDPVLSGSMAPLAHAGDMALTTRVPTSALAVGDVVVFYPPNQTTPVMHRIIELTNTQDGRTSIRTKGDANTVADDWTAILQGTDARRLAFVLPLVGWLTQARGALLIGAGLLLGLVVLVELRRKEGRKLPGPSPA